LAEPLAGEAPDLAKGENDGDLEEKVVRVGCDLVSQRGAVSAPPATT
jgi:hypothetical protein